MPPASYYQQLSQNIEYKLNNGKQKRKSVLRLGDQKRGVEYFPGFCYYCPVAEVSQPTNTAFVSLGRSILVVKMRITVS